MLPMIWPGSHWTPVINTGVTFDGKDGRGANHKLRCHPGIYYRGPVRSLRHTDSMNFERLQQ